MPASTSMNHGTTSDAGNGALVTGRCRRLRGVRVAPLKPQNRAPNSAATADGGAIARAQAVHPQARGLGPHTDFNPVSLKPPNDVDAQVIVHGRARGNLDAIGYHAYKFLALPAVLSSPRRLAGQYQAIVVESAGCPAILVADTDAVEAHLDIPALLALLKMKSA